MYTFRPKMGPSRTKCVLWSCQLPSLGLSVNGDPSGTYAKMEFRENIDDVVRVSEIPTRMVACLNANKGIREVIDILLLNHNRQLGDLRSLSLQAVMSGYATWQGTTLTSYKSPAVWLEPKNGSSFIESEQVPYTHSYPALSTLRNLDR